MGFLVGAGVVFAIVGALTGATVYAVLNALTHRNLSKQPALRVFSALLSVAVTAGLGWAIASTDRGDSLMGFFFFLCAAVFGTVPALVLGAGLIQRTGHR